MATALVLLLGAGIALASGALDDAGRAGDGPTHRADARLPAPALVAPEPALTRLATVDVAGVLPTDLVRAAADRLRVYVNGRVARERGVPGDESFRLSDIPLDEGENEIRAALVGPSGEGELSMPVVVVRDSTPPAIRIARPEAGTTVYGATEALRGRTEAGASLEIVEDGSNPVAASVSEDGRFEGVLHLVIGENVFVLRSADPAGNRASSRVVVTRAMSLASIDLTVSSTEIALADLPETLDAVALVRDELGRASEGADVTFSLSPPNRGTTTYRAVTSGGEARWPDVVVAGDSRAAGVWLVTVLAVLPSGEELRGDASFSVR